jgi:hypothetical protein
MRLITTSIGYEKLEEEDSIKLFQELGLELSSSKDGKPRARYEDLVLTEDEFFKYWKVLSNITHMREV